MKHATQRYFNRMTEKKDSLNSGYFVNQSYDFDDKTSVLGPKPQATQMKMTLFNDFLKSKTEKRNKSENKTASGSDAMMQRAEYMKKELKYRETIKYLKRDLKAAN